MAHKARRRPSWKKGKSKYFEKLKVELTKALQKEIQFLYFEIQKEINREVCAGIAQW